MYKKIIFLFLLFCTYSVMAKIDLRDIFSAFEKEENQTTSLSDKMLQYTNFQEEQTEDPQVVSYDTPYMLLFDTLKLHDLLVGLYTYKDHCDELEKANQLVKTTQKHLEEIEEMNRQLVQKDHIMGKTWDDNLKQDYLALDTKVKTIADYIKQAPAFIATYNTALEKYQQTQNNYLQNMPQYQEKEKAYQTKQTEYELLQQELDGEINEELNIKQTEMENAKLAFEEVKKVQDDLQTTMLNLETQMQGIQTDIQNLLDDVLNSYQTWGTKNNTFNEPLTSENLKSSGIMDTWQAGLDVLKNYYDIRKNPNIPIPYDVDFFKKPHDTGIIIDDDFTAVEALLKESDVYVPIIERTKYVVDIVKGATLDTKKAFYNIPHVWSITYPYFWEKYGCSVHKGNSFIPCDNKTTPTTIAALEAMMCTVISLPVNLRDNGEWDSYFKEPVITAISKTVEEEKSEEVTDPAGQPVIDSTTGDPLTRKWTEQKTASICGGKATLADTYVLKNTEKKQIFRNRFEDYANRLMAAFRALENHRNLQKLTETMRQTNIASLTSFDLASNALTCADINTIIANLNTQKAKKLDKLNDTYKDYFDEANPDNQTPDWQKKLKKAMENKDFSRLFLTISNIAITDDLAKENDAINSIPTATQIYTEEENQFVKDFNTLLGKPLYRDAFQPLTTGGNG